MDSFTQELRTKIQGYNFAFYSSIKNYYLCAALIVLVTTINVIVILREHLNFDQWVQFIVCILGGILGGMLLWRWSENRVRFSEYGEGLTKNTNSDNLTSEIQQFTSLYYVSKVVWVFRVRIGLLLVGGVSLMFLVPIIPDLLKEPNSMILEELIIIFSLLLISVILTPIGYWLKKKDLVDLQDTVNSEIEKQEYTSEKEIDEDVQQKEPVEQSDEQSTVVKKRTSRKRTPKTDINNEE